MKIDHGNTHILCVGVYFPCDHSSHDYSAAIGSINGFIEAMIDKFPGYKLIVAGDFIFQCVAGDKGFEYLAALPTILTLFRVIIWIAVRSVTPINTRHWVINHLLITFLFNGNFYIGLTVLLFWMMLLTYLIICL